MVIQRLLYRCLVFSVALCITACTSTKQQAVRGATVLPKALPRRVAILPFSNSSRHERAGTVVRKMFYNFFSSLNYKDIELEIIDRVLERSGDYEALTRGSAVDIGALCRLLDADGLVFGEVTTFGKTYAVLYSEVRAGLKARMVSCPSGQTIWSQEHVSRISGGGISINPLGLAITATKAFLNLRQETEMRVVADLCAKITATIPNPSSIAEEGPFIRVLVHNGANVLMTPGETFKAVLVGEPGMEAYLTIGSYKKIVKMDERRPGVYAGAYTVESTDRVIGGEIIGFLKDKNGAMRQWIDVLGPVTFAIPTILPQKVDGEVVLEEVANPYLIRGALIIGPGGRLVMGPGVRVWVDGPGIVVRGGLVIDGVRERPVWIMGQGDTQWKGIITDSPLEKVILRYVKVQGAHTGIAAKGADVLVEHSIFTGNDWAMVLDSSQVEIRASLIGRSVRTAISLRGSTAKVFDSAIVQNGLGGVLISSSQVYIHGCAIYDNARWNLKVLGKGAKVDARKNWWGSSDLDEIGKGVVGEGQVNIVPILEKISGEIVPF